VSDDSRTSTPGAPVAGSGEPGDRRAFIKKAGLVGAGVAGVAWAAPSVLSLERAFAVGSCPGGSITFPWSNGATVANGATLHTSANTPLVGTSTTGGIDIRITQNASSGVPGSGLVYNNWKARNGTNNSINCGGTIDTPMGNRSSFYSLEMGETTSCTDPGLTGRWSEVTFGFFDQGTTTPHAVRNLSFTLLDIDTGQYVDQAEVFINGSATAATTGPSQTFPTVVLGPSPSVTQPTAGVARFVGGAAVAGTGTGGNVTLTSNTTTNITTVRVRFTDVRGSAPGTIQWVGIGDLTFCKV
jgi:hypothetical protein